MRSKFLRLLSPLLLYVVSLSGASAASALVLEVARIYGYTQTDASGTLAPGSCAITVSGSYPGYTSSSTITCALVGEIDAVLVTFSSNGSFSGSKTYSSAQAMDLSFPAGTATFTVSEFGATYYDYVVPINVAAVPSAITNFAALQAWPAGQPVAPAWSPIPNAVNTDSIALYAYDTSGNYLAEVTAANTFTATSTTAAFKSTLPTNDPMTGYLEYAQDSYYSYTSGPGPNGTLLLETGFSVGFPMEVVPSPPVVVTQPAGSYLPIGGTFSLSVTATPGSSTPLTYQWYKNGAAITGATASSYQYSGAALTDSGNYYVVIGEGTGNTVTSASAKVTVGAYDPGRIINLSINTVSGTASQVLTAGFVVTGSSGTGQPILVRGIGPTLSTFGVAGALADPSLQLIPASSSTPLASNNSWGGNPTLAAIQAAVGAFALSATSLDSVLYQPSLAPGNYSAVVAGNNGGTGVALAEIYDATPAGTYTQSSPRLINVSGRSQVSTSNTLTGGFTIGGSTNLTVLIRASGPALTAFGLSGLPAPSLQLYQSGATTPMATNNAWGGTAALSAAFTTVLAFPWSNPNSQDCALLLTLPPGGYSAQISSADGNSGVALLEVYEVD